LSIGTRKIVGLTHGRRYECCDRRSQNYGLRKIIPFKDAQGHEKETGDHVMAENKRETGWGSRKKCPFDGKGRIGGDYPKREASRLAKNG